MATKLTTLQWIEVLQDSKLTRQIDLDLLQALYSFPSHQAYASQIGQLLNIPFTSLNLEIGRYAKRIAGEYQIYFSKRIDSSNQYWDLFFKGWNEGRYFVWQLRPELVEAVSERGLADEPFAEELPLTNSNNLFEGAKKTILVNSYERNPIARQQCIKHWGTCCSVCGFSFGATYGALGEGFIHVHHITPIAQIGQVYQIDPVKDLRPVCPNCHAMLHKQEPPLAIDELKAIIQDNK